jgi:hypothetical protein
MAEISTQVGLHREIPWVKANRDFGHQVTVRNGISRIQDIAFGLGSVGPQDFAHQLFYGNPVIRLGEMTGLSQYYNTINPQKAQNAVCVLDGNGRGKHLTSAWVIFWGDRRLYCASPNGQPVPPETKATLVIADWRFAIRIANLKENTSRRKLRGFLERAILMLPLNKEIETQGAIYMNAALQKTLDEESIRHIQVQTAPLQNNEARVI